MCTVSWSPAPGGYQLFFNRDERRSRLPGLAPRLEEEGGTKFLAPRDADAGGTWVAVNQHGLTVGLLNLYQAAAAMPKPGRISRGLLVRALASSRSLEEAARLLSRQDLADYSPFTLVAAAPPLEVLTYAWDGRNAGKWLPATPPVVSSGHDVVGATASRTELFACFGLAGRLTWQDLHDFHRSHQPEKGAYSPCMHRADAKTVSLTAILVGPERVRLAYAPGSPCVTELGPFLELYR
jgi:hypothetical protein